MRLAHNLNRAFSNIAFRNAFQPPALMLNVLNLCLLYTSDAADEP